MRRLALLLLLPLLTAASKPERTDPLLQVGPLVRSVVAGSSTLEPKGGFFPRPSWLWNETLDVPRRHWPEAFVGNDSLVAWPHIAPQLGITME